LKSIFRATAILSAGSVASILFGLVSAKVMAIILQPAGYGFYGLLGSFVGLATLVTGVGIGTGLVREGAGAVTRGDELTISSLRRASWALSCGLGALALLTLVLFRWTISRLVFGTPKHATTILLMGIPLLFSLVAAIQSGILNAYHRVEALAKCSVATTALSATWGITCFLIWGARGIVPAVIGGAMVVWMISAYFLRREVGPVRVQPMLRDVQRMAWSLLRFGAPFTVSMLVGTGVQLALPIIVLHLLGTESVGYYKAAAAISVNYLGFLATAMGQDFYPRVSAVREQAGALVELINEQHRLVIIVVVPTVLGTLALVPYLVPVVYSRRFLPAVEILEWQLIGDLFKFSSWTLSFAILACCRSSVFFLTESIGGLANIVTLWLAVRWFGLSGLGISFLVSYIIYYAAVWLIVRREIHLVWTLSNKVMMWPSFPATLLVRFLPSTVLVNLTTPIAYVLACAAGAWSLRTVWGELWGRTESRAV
jgi:PST family polysaccharide transporter